MANDPSPSTRTLAAGERRPALAAERPRAPSETADTEWTAPPRIAEFRLERPLGRGASADVWLAFDTLLEREVALKIFRSKATPEARARFRVEARAVARLHHPNVIAVHAFGDAGGRPYLVTERVVGASLAELALPLEASQVTAIGRDLARGLAAAHCAGVVHRDIKPANAFLCDDGTAKLLDFGIAELRDGDAAAHESTGVLEVIVGTPLYMAPETWRGEPADRPTDVYSLGALLFELLSGRPPVVERDLGLLSARVTAGEIGDLSVLAAASPAKLVDLVRRCLDVDPSRRPSAEAVESALESLEADVTHERAPRDTAGAPYPGLTAFGRAHEALFFGREAEIDAVVSALRAHPFVLVVGPSGAGKSSLVAAGVVPRAEGALGHAAMAMTPGVHPLGALARAYATATAADEREVTAKLVASPAWLARELRARRGALLVIDQMEEIWTIADLAERAPFLEAVAAIARAGKDVHVLATLRADFLPYLEDLGELKDEALRGAFVLRPLSAAGLARCIAEPARTRGVTIEPALLDRLTAAAERGSLPLLAFALAALWERRAAGDATLGLPLLEAIGGVEGALSRHADGVLARLPEAARAEARRILLALVTVEGTRARREEQELVADHGAPAREALDALVSARLVVASAGEHRPEVELAHEALLASWPTLRSWLEEEAAARDAEDRVRRAASEWERLERSGDALFGARRLGGLGALAGRALDAKSAAFLAASRAAVNQARRRRRLLAVGIPLALAAIGAGTWGVLDARHHAAARRALETAHGLLAKADQGERAARALRGEAIARFDRDDVPAGETVWADMLVREEEVDRERRDACVAIDHALSLTPGDSAARGLIADVIVARLIAAERLHERTLLDDLRARLALYDDGSRAASLSAPALVSVETDPREATIVLVRYREDAAGHLALGDDRVLVTRPREEALEPGSYTLVAEAPGRTTTRYPFVARRGERRALQIALPRAADVPEGMVYVPRGTFLYGSGDDEGTRAIFHHQPIHDVELPAFLIARTEVTNGEYVAYLHAAPEEARPGNVAATFTWAADGALLVKIHGARFREGERYCPADGPCVDWARLPVDAASFDDGERYAAWLARTGRLRGARICADREWERAARGADGRRFPQGDAELGPDDACTLATYGGDARRAVPCVAGTHPASRSPFGVEDLLGSEWEWTSGAGGDGEAARMTRGASFLDMGDFVTLTNRSSAPRSAHWVGRGLRICADAP